MAHHAGFALAISLKESAVNRNLLLAHHAAPASAFNPLLSARTEDEKDLQLDCFVGPATIACRAATPSLLELTVEGWGNVTIPGLNNTPSFLGDSEVHGVKWRAKFQVTPVLQASGGRLSLVSSAEQFALVDWHLENFSTRPLDHSDQLQPAIFRPRVDEPLRTFLAMHLGSLALTVVTTPAPVRFTEVRVLDGALAAGYDFGTQGAVADLSDFTGDEDLALAVHPDLVQPLLFPTAEADLAELVQTFDAELKHVAFKMLDGVVQVKAHLRASHADVDLTLKVAPVLFAERPGGWLSDRKQTMRVRPRRWAILGFEIIDLDTDVDFDNWVVGLVYGIGIALGGVGGGVLGYWAFNVVRGLVQDQADTAVGTPVEDGQLPAPRLVRTPSARHGDPAIKTKLERFDVHPDGVEMAIRSWNGASLAHIVGPVSLARNLLGESVRFERRLGLYLHPDDKTLIVEWEVRDLNTNALLLTQDHNAPDPLSLVFAPATLANDVMALAIKSTISRKLSAQTFELDVRTAELHIGAPLPSHPFVRWRYDVKNPQVRFFPPPNGEPKLVAEALHHRWSKIHRIDRPCLNASHRSRYRFEEHAMNVLPFPLTDIEAKRGLLCDYCFFGGPGRDRVML
jgi:hypothetical protein